jgi:hypothetical protein
MVAATLELRARRKETAAMKPPYSLRHSLLLSLLMLLFLLPAIPSEGARAIAAPPPDETRAVAQGTGPTVKEPGNKAGRIDRIFDPVLVQGKWLTDLLGSGLGALRLYRYRDGQYETIRFQADERTVEGDWVFPHGKKNNGSEGNGLLDGRDMLLFMACDAGERAHPDTPPQGASSVTEIELKDPVDAGRAWVYLAAHEADPPPLCPLPDYVRYNYETEEVSTDFSYYKFIITEEGLHTGFSDVGAILPAAGGDGENRIDRMKTRIQIRFFFNLVPLSLNEEMLGQDVAAYIAGPVRVIRRLEQFFKLPFGLRGMKSVTDLHLYESLTIVPAEINVPKGVDKVISSSHMWFGADMSPNAIGSLFRNSENLEPLIIDGRMSEMEKQFSPQQDKWRVIYGHGGAMLIRGTIFVEDPEVAEIRHRYVDDISVVEPPEKYKGSIGVVKTEMVSKKPKAGRYDMLMEVYFPPHYRPGDEAGCLNVRDRPLRIRIHGKTHVNQLNPD